VRGYLRSLNPQLSRPVWILQAGSFANAFGNGIVWPFLLIYLHNVRGIPLGTAGLVLGANGVAGLIAGPVAGALLDRVGPRAVLVFSMSVSAAGFGGYALVHEPWQAFVAAVVSGIGNGAFWSSHAAILAGLTRAADRHRAYAMQRVTNNLGIGLGGAVGGLIATTSSPGTYTALFVIDAITFGGYIAAIAFVPSPPRVPHEERRAAGGYRQVFRNRTFVAVVVLDMLLVSVGFAWLQDIFPAFAKNHAGVGERAIGLIFLANTLVIVAVQLPIAKLLEGRRRMLAYAVEGGLWSVAWLIVLGGGAALDGPNAAIVFAFAVSVFAVGECFHGTVRNALVVDLADPPLLGRYLAVLGAEFQLGFSGGRALGGFVLAASPLGMWAFAAALAAVCAVAALFLERRLPERIRRTPMRELPPVTEPA
jgi:MFS family permease